jgi:hypothetical protein
LEIPEAAADIHRLLLLDASWTGAERYDEIGERGREALVSLANKLDAQYAIVERQAHALRQTFDRYSGWVNEISARALASEHLSTHSQAIRALLEVENDDDFAGRGAAAAEVLARRAPLEREELRRKGRALRKDGPIETDASHPTLCAAAQTIAATTPILVLNPATAGLGDALGALVVISAAAGVCD